LIGHNQKKKGKKKGKKKAKKKAVSFSSNGTGFNPVF
jgi:hypothetical protein